MARPEKKLTQIVDGENHSIQATVEQVGLQGAQVVKSISSGSFIEEAFDGIEITYVAAGNGQGEIETVTYKQGATVVAVLTLGYDVDDNVISVVRT